MRTNLKVFRVKQNMTQDDFAEKLGISRSCYALIEKGKRNGTLEFWNKIHKVFNVPTDEMWDLLKNDETK